MTNTSSAHQASLPPHNKGTHPFVSPESIPPLLQALRDRARWFHEHPTQSDLLMRLEENAHRRQLG
jgi:hypothetical protein